MKRDDAMPTDRPPRIEHRDDAPGSREDQAERFRATARRIALQAAIEETMWQMLGKET
mgnify:CR=1 FL=1